MKPTAQQLRRNISLLYAIKAVRGCMLLMPIVVLFFKENGLSMREILLLQSVFWLTITLFEIPSGYFADVIGRKHSIVVGGISATVGMATYALAHGFWGLCVAEVLLGISASFVSGADSALLYDSLLALGERDTFMRRQGRMDAAANFSEAVASIVGGCLALISLRTPVVAELFVFAALIPLGMSLVEPPQVKRVANGGLRAMARIVRYSLHDHKEVKWLILYSGLVSTSTLCMLWFNQPYFSNIGLPLGFYGIVWAACTGSVGFFSLYAERVERFLGRKRAFVILIFISVCGYAAVSMTHAMWGIGFLLLFQFVRGIARPVLKDYINRVVDSDIRATVLSVQNLACGLLFAVLGPLAGWLHDVTSLSVTLATLGGFFAVSGLLVLWRMRRHGLV